MCIVISFGCSVALFLYETDNLIGHRCSCLPRLSRRGYHHSLLKPPSPDSLYVSFQKITIRPLCNLSRKFAVVHPSVELNLIVTYLSYAAPLLTFYFGFETNKLWCNSPINFHCVCRYYALFNFVNYNLFL